MIGFKEKSKEGKITKIVVINATEKKGVTFRLKKAFLSRFKNKARFFFFICSLVFEPCGAFLFGSNLICYIIEV